MANTVTATVRNRQRKRSDPAAAAVSAGSACGLGCRTAGARRQCPLYPGRLKPQGRGSKGCERCNSSWPMHRNDQPTAELLDSTLESLGKEACTEACTTGRTTQISHSILTACTWQRPPEGPAPAHRTRLEVYCSIYKDMTGPLTRESDCWAVSKHDRTTPASTRVLMLHRSPS